MDNWASNTDSTHAFDSADSMAKWSGNEIAHNTRVNAKHRNLAASILERPSRAPLAVIQAAGDVLNADFVSPGTIRALESAQ